jgi:hypothetical protein
VNSHYHPLVRTSSRAQRRSCGQRTLGIDDAVADFSQVPAQRLAKEHFVPVAVPGDTRGTAASSQRQPDTENGNGEHPSPRERCQERRTGFRKIAAQLLDVRLNARAAFLSQDGRDYQWRGRLMRQFRVRAIRSAIVFPHRQLSFHAATLIRH